jgi:hypothetical protein
VDGVVEERDGVADDTADDFRADQAEGGGHGPTEDAGAQGWMFVAMVAVAVTVGMTEMRVAVAVRGGVRCRAM